MGAYPLSPGERNPQIIVNAIKQTGQGRLDCTGSVTLRTGFATTVVLSPTAGVGNEVFLFPQTSAAAAEVASVFVPLVSVAGQFTINHPNNATTGRTWSWVVLG